jgi:hypothetical protein
MVRAMFQQNGSLSLAIALSVSGVFSSFAPANALPPSDDLPEEILRTEIILEARSPLTGEPLTPEEYAELQAALEAQQEAYRPPVSPEVANIIRLLYIRRAIRTIFPFLLR